MAGVSSNPDSFGQGYDLKEDPGFAESVRECFQPLQRWDEVMSGLDFVLSRFPLAGKRIGESPIFYWALASNPPAALYYNVDEDSRIVHLMKVYCLEQ